MSCRIYMMTIDGERVQVSMRGSNLPEPCSLCGDMGGLLCDWPDPTSGRALGLCSKSLCRSCRVPGDGGRDYCPDHLSHHQEALL